MITQEIRTPLTVTECCHGEKVYKATNYFIQAQKIPEIMQRLSEHNPQGNVPWTTLRDLSQD